MLRDVVVLLVLLPMALWLDGCAKEEKMRNGNELMCKVDRKNRAYFTYMSWEHVFLTDYSLAMYQSG